MLTPTVDAELISRWNKALPQGHGTRAFTKTATVAEVTRRGLVCCCGGALIRANGTLTHTDKSVLCPA